MPIINRRNPTAPPAPESAPEPVAPAAATAPSVATSPSQERAARNVAKPVALGLIALIVGVAVPFIAYRVAQGIPSDHEGDDEPELTLEPAAGDIELDLQRLQKIAGMAALIQKEYEMNTVSRAEAEKKAEPMTLAALDAILDKNRRELADARQRMAEVLVQMHAAYEDTPRKVKQRFDAAIANAEEKHSPDIVKALKVGFEALEGAPDDAALDAHFKHVITENL